MKEKFPDGCVKVHWGKPSSCPDEEWYVDAVKHFEQLANKMECIPCDYDANKAFMVRVLLPSLPFSFEACAYPGALRSLSRVHMQAVRTRCQQLAAAIQARFCTKRLLLIIDDVWNLECLDELDLVRDCDSSVLVTSREALPGAWSSWEEVQITGKSNEAQQEGILASYVADKSSVDTVQPHLKVWPDC